MKYTHDANTRSCLSYYGTNNNIVNSFVIRNNFSLPRSRGNEAAPYNPLDCMLASAAAPYF
jgi:hypothetical protein